MKRRNFLRNGLATLAAGASTTVEAQRRALFPLELFMCRRPVKVRRNINELYDEDNNHPIILNYRKAVQVMKSRPDSDPTSWAYQANIHGTTLSPGSWPAGAPFATCEHWTQFFLSWHRMYLYFFERIARKACGNPDFALPYWDWAADRRLPIPFRDPTIGTDTNPLYDGSRNPGINAGNAMPHSAVYAGDDLLETSYFSFQSGVEGTPHGTIHGTIGGNMGNFAGAGRDPIFWLHHCNIDRLWEVWLFTNTMNSNPTGNATWMNQTYTFALENGSLTTMKGADILDTETQLRYVYEHTCRSPFSFLLTRNLQLKEARRIMSSHFIAKDVKLDPDAERIELRQRDPAEWERLAKSLALFSAPDRDTRILLVFDGIKSEAPVNGYVEVYVNLPKGAKTFFESPYYAGNIDFFGSDAASRRSMMSKNKVHAEHGLTKEVDATRAFQQLFARGEIGKEGLSITLVPAGVSVEGKSFRLERKAAPTIETVSLLVVDVAQ